MSVDSQNITVVTESETPDIIKYAETFTDEQLAILNEKLATTAIDMWLTGNRVLQIFVAPNLENAFRDLLPTINYPFQPQVATRIKEMMDNAHIIPNAAEPFVRLLGMFDIYRVQEALQVEMWKSENSELFEVPSKNFSDENYTVLLSNEQVKLLMVVNALLESKMPKSNIVTATRLPESLKNGRN